MTIAETHTGFTRKAPAPARYPVNIRITIPFLPRSLFVTFIVGPERRGGARLREERQRHPVNTWGNLFTFIGTWTIFSISALFAAMILSSL